MIGTSFYEPRVGSKSDRKQPKRVNRRNQPHKPYNNPLGSLLISPKLPPSGLKKLLSFYFPFQRHLSWVLSFHTLKSNLFYPESNLLSLARLLLPLNSFYVQEQKKTDKDHVVVMCFSNSSLRLSHIPCSKRELLRKYQLFHSQLSSTVYCLFVSK